MTWLDALNTVLSVAVLVGAYRWLVWIADQPSALDEPKRLKDFYPYPKRKEERD